LVTERSVTPVRSVSKGKVGRTRRGGLGQTGTAVPCPYENRRDCGKVVVAEWPPFVRRYGSVRHI